MNPQKLRQIVCAPAGDSEAGGSDSTGTLAQAKEKITSTARDTAARIKSAASDTAERAKSEAQRIASETKEQTASRIGGYGSAMYESAKSFEQQDPNIAWATHRVADRIQGMADYVRTSDLSDLRADAENFARRHPLAFFGGLFIGGLVIGNLLKARRTEDETPADEQWDAGNQSGSDLTDEESMASGM
jgi:hypothetical protein